ncbi:MAG: alginate export family protein [Candidatus Zixiibacteriota bacterium]|nr:MAG: alginate export family protein [candidate division Zixibacteria bacterium]
MSSLIRSLTIGLLAMLVGAIAMADTTVESGGQVRIRGEIADKSFGDAETQRTFVAMRTRVNLTARVDDNATAFVQFQDTRTLGGYDQFSQPQSGTLYDGKNVDIHQAYVQMDKIWWDGFGARVGRFEFILGNQRAFGAVGWSNVGRAWEGGVFWYGKENFKVSAFNLKVLEVNDTRYNRDFDIIGLNLDWVKPDLELFGVYEYNADTTFYTAGINKLDRIDLGLYYRREHNQFDFTLNGIYQTGKQPVRVGTLIDTVNAELDIAAFMAAFEIGYSLEGESNARVAAGIDYASGDDNDSDSDFKAYNNLYYTGHKFRGYMDYFAGAEASKAYANAGLMDLMLRGRFDIAPGWTLKGDFHYFTAAADYRDPTDTTVLTTDIGMEFDFTMVTTSIAGVKWQAGISIFLPKDAFAGRVDPDPGLWLYDMVTINF